MRLDVGHEGFDLGHRADYLTDGTVIRWVDGTACGPGQPCGSLERNTLTATALTALRALVAQDADLLATPMVFKREIAPGTHPLLRGDVLDAFVMERLDGTRYTVEVPSTTSQDASTWVPDPAITRLNALAAALLDPATVVGDHGLGDPAWAAYEPSATAVVVRLTAAIKPVPFDGPYGPDIQKTGWPFGGTPDTFGSTFAPHASDGFFASARVASFRCAFLAHAATMKAIASLPDAGARLAQGEVMSGGVWGSSGLRWGDDLDFGMRAVALLPEDVAGSCADAFTY